MLYRIFHYIFYVSFSTTLGGCLITNNTNKAKSYNEDLTKYRTQYSFDLESVPKADPLETAETVVWDEAQVAKPTQHINDELDGKVQDIFDANLLKTIKYKGYRVLVYSGFDQKAALSIEKALKKDYEEEVDIAFKQPNYKVTIGNFISKTEAHLLYYELKKTYPLAHIIEDIVVFKESDFTEVDSLSITPDTPDETND